MDASSLSVPGTAGDAIITVSVGRNSILSFSFVAIL